MSDFENSSSISEDNVSDLGYLKSDNLWLEPFQLTDAEFSEVIRLMIRIIIGSDPIFGFRERLSEALKRDNGFINDLVVAILTNRFLELKPHIIGFDEFVKSLGLEGLALKTQINKNIKSKTMPDYSQELSQKMSQYDWQKMSPLEKRITMEELGINSKQLDSFLKKNL